MNHFFTNNPHDQIYSLEFLINNSAHVNIFFICLSCGKSVCHNRMSHNISYRVHCGSLELLEAN